jgi:hypothetical protein
MDETQGAGRGERGVAPEGAGQFPTIDFDDKSDLRGQKALQAPLGATVAEILESLQLRKIIS